MSRNASPKNNFKVNGYSFKQVEEFKYLGVNNYEKNNMQYRNQTWNEHSE